MWCLNQDSENFTVFAMGSGGHGNWVLALSMRALML
jgi:hypothetical protein